ncbi:hypothetical protein L208DRAFT_1397915 [Tricholoma matsutake]|nr:hypothetical protein L208DRAFT_1397915 [Tricholoma matsutake 945]
MKTTEQGSRCMGAGQPLTDGDAWCSPHPFSSLVLFLIVVARTYIVGELPYEHLLIGIGPLTLVSFAHLTAEVVSSPLSIFCSPVPLQYPHCEWLFAAVVVVLLAVLVGAHGYGAHVQSSSILPAKGGGSRGLAAEAWACHFGVVKCCC